MPDFPYEFSPYPSREAGGFGDHPLLLYVANAAGYQNLCTILSRHAEDPIDEASVANKQRQPLKRSILADNTEGLLAVSSDPSLAEMFPNRFYRAVVRGEGEVACPAVHYAKPEDRRRYDVLQSIRTLTLLQHDHPEKRKDGHFHFRTPVEMATTCSSHPEWLRTAREIADRCEFEFPFGKPQFPAFIAPDGSSSRDFLRKLVFEGVERRYTGKSVRSDAGNLVPFGQVRSQIEEELSIIGEVGYEDRLVMEVLKCVGDDANKADHDE